MPGTNGATISHHGSSDAAERVFISHRLADRNVAKAVGEFLADKAKCAVYCSHDDAELKDAIEKGSDEKLVESIDKALIASTRLLGIISNHTKGSWWVPYEFGASRHYKRPIAVLLLEEVTELPSYMKVADLLRDSNALVSWAQRVSPSMFKKGVVYLPPHLPGVPAYRTATLTFK